MAGLTRFGAAGLLVVAALVLLWQAEHVAADGEERLLLSKLNRIARSPQLPNPHELAERAREAANMAKDMAKQHMAERVAEFKDKVEQAKGAASSVQAMQSGDALPSSITSMANNA